MNDCSDGNCKLRIGPPPGQHTNGGCRCLQDIPTPLRLRIERKMASMRYEIACLKDRIEELETNLEIKNEQ